MATGAMPRLSYPGRGLHGDVVERLGRRIVGGRPAPGEALLQEPLLADEFDVSRTVIREALRVLAAKGLVEARPMRGTRVRPRDQWRMLDPDLLRWALEADDRQGLVVHLSEIRRLVEPGAARLAAERSTASGRRRLQAAMDELVAGSGDLEAFIDADLRLHGVILQMTSNPLLAQLTAPIEAALRQGRLIQAAGAEATERTASASLRSHRELVEAIVAGDAVRAELAMQAVVESAASDAAQALGRRAARSAQA